MFEVGDIVTRIWGDGYMVSQVRVSALDEEFIYCDAQRKDASQPWMVLPPGSEPWKFDRVYGVETDEEQGWGLRTTKRPNLRNICLSRITLS